MSSFSCGSFLLLFLLFTLGVKYNFAKYNVVPANLSIARGFSYKSSKTMDSDKKDSTASQDEGIERIK
jgi:hypothetical protein